MARWGVIAAIAVLGLTACKDRAADGNDSAAVAAAEPSLLKALDNSRGLGATRQLVKQAGLEKMLDGVGSYTLFAPTDNAIAALPEADRQRLGSVEGRPQLIALLRQHIAPGYIGSGDIDTALRRKDGTVRLATVGGAPIVLSKSGEAIVLGSGADAARMTGQPVVARNGVIYPIDRVLPPPRAK